MPSSAAPVASPSRCGTTAFRHGLHQRRRPAQATRAVHENFDDVVDSEDPPLRHRQVLIDRQPCSAHTSFKRTPMGEPLVTIVVTSPPTMYTSPGARVSSRTSDSEDR